MEIRSMYHFQNGISGISYRSIPTIETDYDAVFVPMGCKVVGGYAFRNLPNLNTIYLPNSLTLFNVTALSGLDRLEWIVVHNFPTVENTNLASVFYEYPDTFLDSRVTFNTDYVSKALELYREDRIAHNYKIRCCVMIGEDRN